MAKRMRQIIKIDEDLCNGCGLCASACAEGALKIIDGKAKLVSETYCDGLGACLGECPQGAITIESREAEDFDEAAVTAHLAAGAKPAHSHDHGHAHSGGFVCPSARIIDRTHEAQTHKSPEQGNIPSEVRNWPVKLYLVNPQAPYFQGADLLVSADCVPFTYGGMHPDFIKGKTLVCGCPKFDDTELYLNKLTEIVKLNDIKSITVLKMEVPCCSGMLRIAEMAVAASGKNVPIKAVTVTLDGKIAGD